MNNILFLLPSSFEAIIREDQICKVQLDKSLFFELENQDFRIISRNLTSLEEDTSQNIEQILEKENFTNLYFVIHFLQQKIKKIDCKTQCEKIVLFIRDYLPFMMKQSISQFKNGSIDRAIPKLFFFFLTFAIGATSQKPNKNYLINMQQKQNGVKQKEQNDYQIKITDFHKKCLPVMRELLQVRSFGEADNQQDTLYARYYSESLFLLLENKNLVKVCKEELYSIIMDSISEDPQSLMFMQSKVINLLYEDENIVQQLAEILIKVNRSDQARMKNMIIDIINMVADFALNTTQTSETQSLKNVQKFFTILSQNMSKVFKNNISLFLKFYDSELYLLRNIITQILSNILQYDLCPLKMSELDTEQQEQQQQQRYKLFKVFFSRLHDKAAFCRSFVLNQTKILLDSNLIPADLLLINFQAICGRIKDQSSIVRKNNLKLIKSILKYFWQIYVGDQINGSFMTLKQIDYQIDEQLLSLQDANQVGIEEIQNEIMNCKDELKFAILEGEIVRLNEDILKQKREIEIFKQYKEVMIHIQSLIPSLNQLLTSKQSSDVLKTISLMYQIKKMSIEIIDIKNMVILVWHIDKVIQEKMLKTFFKLFLNFQEDKNLSTDMAINNLVTIFQSYSLKQQISLEQMLLIYCRQDKKIPDQFLERLWDSFLQSFRRDDALVIPLIHLVKVLFMARPRLFDQRKTEVFAQIIQKYKHQQINWSIVIRIVQLIRNIGQNNVIRDFFKHACYLLWINFGTDDPAWFSACQDILRLNQSISSPEAYYRYLLVKLTTKLLASSSSIPPSKQRIAPMNDDQSFLQSDHKKQSSQQSSNKTGLQVAQLLFVVGEVSIRLLLHFNDIGDQLKQLKNKAEKRIEEQKEDQNDSDLDKIQGGFEAEFEFHQQRVTYISEQSKNINLNNKDTVQGDFMQQYHKLILSIIQPILSRVNDEDGKISNSQAEQMAVLALAKFMCLSETYCAQHIDLLFNLLESCACDAVIKNNLVVSLGDLLHRWPNTVTHYSNKIFQNLKDSDFNVKKTSLNVVTHLVLNDMVKIKSEICEIGLLLSDKDKKISQLSRLFFHELHKKDNKIIYNTIPEIIYRFSKFNNDNEQFIIFIDYIAKYIEKDKNLETLTEKLIKRMKDQIDVLEARNIAYTLTQFNLKETSFKLLTENASFYQEWLTDDYIKQQFLKVSQRFARRNPNNTEAKTLLEEYEQLISHGQERRRFPNSKQKTKPINILKDLDSPSTTNLNGSFDDNENYEY